MVLKFVSFHFYGPQARGYVSSDADDFESCLQDRYSRTGFYQALLGKHPLHFIKCARCPHCGASFDSDNILLDHALFDCNQWQSERACWISDLESYLLFNYKDDLDISMNETLLSIIKQSTKNTQERTCQTKTIKLVAFGGHTALKVGDSFVVTRKNRERLLVSDILSQSTARFLYSVTNKIKNNPLYPQNTKNKI